LIGPDAHVHTNACCLNASKRWVWHAICKSSGKVLAFHIGKRNAASCKKLLAKLQGLKIGLFFVDN